MSESDPIETCPSKPSVTPIRSSSGSAQSGLLSKNSFPSAPGSICHILPSMIVVLAPGLGISERHASQACSIPTRLRILGSCSEISRLGHWRIGVADVFRKGVPASAPQNLKRGMSHCKHLSDAGESDGYTRWHFEHVGEIENSSLRFKCRNVVVNVTGTLSSRVS